MIRLFYSPLFKQVIVFGIIGVIATLVHYSVALSATELGNIVVYIANLMGYLCAVGVSYFGHGLITFRNRLTHSNFQKFAFVSVLAFLLSEVLLVILEESLQFSHRLSLGIIVVSIPILSFFANKFWVFTHK